MFPREVIHRRIGRGSSRCAGAVTAPGHREPSRRRFGDACSEGASAFADCVRPVSESPVPVRTESGRCDPRHEICRHTRGRIFHQQQVQGPFRATAERRRCEESGVRGSWRNSPSLDSVVSAPPGGPPEQVRIPLGGMAGGDRWPIPRGRASRLRGGVGLADAQPLHGGEGRWWPDVLMRRPAGSGALRVRQDGTSRGGELMGKIEFTTLEADVTLLAVEMADLAALMEQVRQEVKRLLRASGPSVAESAPELR